MTCFLDSGSAASQAQAKRAVVTLEDESMHVIAAILAISTLAQPHERTMNTISFCI
jgi:hypothetical protein